VGFVLSPVPPVVVFDLSPVLSKEDEALARAILLLFFDTGLRLSELAGLRSVDLRPDGSVKVMGKGARERIVPVGTTARQALARCHRRDIHLQQGQPALW
jgi:site-specific recombinase XerC